LCQFNVTGFISKGYYKFRTKTGNNHKSLHGIHQGTIFVKFHWFRLNFVRHTRFGGPEACINFKTSTPKLKQIAKDRVKHLLTHKPEKVTQSLSSPRFAFHI
jgi:hypothetical protein